MRRPLPPVRAGQQTADRQLHQPACIFHDDQRIRPMIQDQLTASPARRHHRHLAVDLIRFRMSYSDNSLDCSVAFQQCTAECDRLGADRHATDRRAEVNAGPDSPIGAAHRRRHRVPERPVMPCQHIVGSRNQRMIGRFQRKRESTGGLLRLRLAMTVPPTQRPRPPRPCLRSPAWCWRRRPIARGPSARSPRRPPCGRAGIAWRSRGPGRSAGCRD